MIAGAGGSTEVKRRASPIARLVLYYASFALAVIVLLRVVPATAQVFAIGTLGELPEIGGKLAPDALVRAREGVDASAGLGIVATAVIAMLGAVALMVPVVWVYMLTKRRSGYDQSVVQTMIVLPLVVCGVMFVVTSSRDALALAFALAAIVAAVRFRNTLKDTKDTVYVFLAIGVGLAAGVRALALAAVMSLLFNLVILVLWRLNVGNLYADQLGRTERLRPGEALAVGDPQLLAALTPAELEAIAERVARLETYIAARRGDKKKKRFNGIVLVHATAVDPAQRAAEAVFEEETSRWKLAEIVPAASGASTLEYLVRLKDQAGAGALLELLRSRAAPHVLGAEFRSLKGLKGREA